MEDNQPTKACNPEYIKYVKDLKEEEMFLLDPEGNILPEAASTEL